MTPEEIEHRLDEVERHYRERRSNTATYRGKARVCFVTPRGPVEVVMDKRGTLSVRTIEAVDPLTFDPIGIDVQPVSGNEIRVGYRVADPKDD